MILGVATSLHLQFGRREIVCYLLFVYNIYFIEMYIFCTEYTFLFLIITSAFWMFITNRSFESKSCLNLKMKFTVLLSISYSSLKFSKEPTRTESPL